MRTILSAAMIAVFCSSGMFAQENTSVAGKWKLTVETPHGAMQFALDLKQEGSKISGTSEHEGETHPVTGSVQQNQISLTFEPRQDAALAFKGTVSQDKMSGTAEAKSARPGHAGRRGALSWTATRTTKGGPDAQALTKPVLGTVTEFKVESLEIGIQPDDGATSFVRFGPETEVVRVPPGEVNLEKATPAKVTDIALGDRVLASFVAGMTEARRIVVISATDIVKRDEAERENWRKRGVSGVVASANGSEVILEARSMEGVRRITVAMTPKTIYRRYTPGSVKFADARPSTMDKILKGDQVQARGEKSGDGLRVTAEEVVSGTFLTRMGPITTIDADAREITIGDVATKQTFIVRFTEDSKLKKLPDFPAMLANRAHRGNDGASRPHEMSQMLERLAPAKFEDLKVGGSVVVSSTKGANSDSLTAITLLTNAEFIIQMMQPEAAGESAAHGGIDASNFRARHGGMFGPSGLSLPAILP